MLTDKMLEDIKSEIDTFIKRTQFGSVTVKVNIFKGTVRNINFMPEKSVKYE